MKMTDILHIPVFLLCISQLHGQPINSFDFGPRIPDYGSPTDTATGFDSFPRSYSGSSFRDPYQFDGQGPPNFRDRSLHSYDGFRTRGSRPPFADRLEPLERGRPRLSYTDPYRPSDRGFSTPHMVDPFPSSGRTEYRDPYITPDRRSASEYSAGLGSHSYPSRMRDRYEPIDRPRNNREMLNEFNTYERHHELPRYTDFPRDYAPDFGRRRSMTIDPWTGERIYRPTWDHSVTGDRNMRRAGYSRFESHFDSRERPERMDRSRTRGQRITDRTFTQPPTRDHLNFDSMRSTTVGNSRGVIKDSSKSDLVSSRRSNKSNRQNRRRQRRLNVSRQKDNLISKTEKPRNQQAGQGSVNKALIIGSDTPRQTKKKRGKEVIANKSSGLPGAKKSARKKLASSKRQKSSQSDLPSDKKRVEKNGKNDTAYKAKEEAAVDKQTVTEKPENEAPHTTDKPILVNLPNAIHDSFAGIAIIDLSPFGVDATSLSNQREAPKGQANSNNIEYSTLAQAITSNLDAILSNATNAASTNATGNKGDKSNVISTPEFEVMFLNVNDTSLSAEIKTLLSNNSQEIIAILNEAPSHKPHQQGSTEPPGTTTKKGLQSANGPGYKDYIKYMFPSEKYALAAMLGLGKQRVPGRASPSATFTPTSDSNIANAMTANFGLQGRLPNGFNGNIFSPDLLLQNAFMEGMF